MDPELRRIDDQLTKLRKEQQIARDDETKLRKRAQDAIKRIEFELEREEKRIENEMRSLDRKSLTLNKSVRRHNQMLKEDATTSNETPGGNHYVLIQSWTGYSGR